MLNSYPAMWRFNTSLQLKIALLIFECVYLCCALSLATTSAERSLLTPTEIECFALTQSYPVTLMSKLFSSVPKREFAIEDITLSFGKQTDEANQDEHAMNSERINNFVLMQGRSASGKSTLLRILSGTEQPQSGNVLLNGSNLYDDSGASDNTVLLPKPVFMDTKPDCYDKKYTVLERIISAAGVETSTIIEGLAQEFASILNLSDAQLNDSPPALSPSGQYLFGIACACMESSCASMQKSVDGHGENQSSHPVLLLDELLDKESSLVAKTVGKGIQQLTRRGAIVLCATHRPEYLRECADRLVTLSGGKILVNEECK